MRRFALAILVVLGLIVSAVAGLAVLYDYRFDKVTGQADHAARAWKAIKVGMNADQVRILAGSPSAHHGSCWTWGEGWFSDAETVFRVCFERGLVTRKSKSYTGD